jgi:hypothetical protein
MTRGDEILVRVLAVEDATRLPIRASGWDSALPAARHQMAADLAAGGLPFRSGAEDAQAAVATSRALVALHEAGLAHVSRRAKTKYPRVRLTDAGDARARALAGLPDLAAGAALAFRAAELAPRFAGEWTPEMYFLDPRYADTPPPVGYEFTVEDRHRLGEIELEYVVAARAGWMRCTSSVLGATAYQLTLAGLGASADPPPDVPTADAAAALYRETQDAALRAMAVDDPLRPREVGSLPAPHCEMYARPRGAP